MRIPIVVGPMLALLALLAVAPPPVAADCGSQPSPPAVIGVAFTGVVAAIDEVREGTFRLTIRVDRTLAGPADRQAVLETGDYADCHMLDGSAFQVGDELAVIGTRWWRADTLSYPLAWRRTADGSWSLDRVARSNRRRLPAELKAVDTLAEIISIVRGALPATDGASAPATQPGWSPHGPLVLLAGGLAALFALPRRRRSGREDEPAQR